MKKKKRRFFISLLCGSIYSVSLCSQAGMNESPADKDRWEFNLPEDAQVFGQYITDNGLYYILDDWKTSVYRGRKEEKLNSFKLEGDDKHSNIFDSKITQLGYDDQIYIANAN
ncbi:hypothetical protein, partial [Enterobacter bugandensis]